MYNYQTEKAQLFTEDGVALIMKVQNKINQLFTTQKVILMEDIIQGLIGSSWQHLAAVDYLKEKGHLREISGQGVAGQHRVFVKP